MDLIVLARDIIRWGVRFGIVIMLVSAFLLVYNLVGAGINATWSGSVLHEIMSFVQIWLPFNLGTVVAWLTNVATLVFGYYMYQWSIKIVNLIVGDS